jgi:mRNA-degrading endonuclease RelE of RelBE toxin-antitoxin system
MNKTEKLLQKLTPKQRNLILTALAALYAGQVSNKNIKALKGHNNTFRLRVGSYRIIFLSTDGRIELIAVVRRDDQTYRDF